MSKIQLLDLFEKRETLPVIEKVMFKNSPIFALRVDFKDWRMNDLIFCVYDSAGVENKLVAIKSSIQYQSLHGIEYFSMKKYLLREVEIIKEKNNVFYRLTSRDVLMKDDYFKSVGCTSVVPIPKGHDFTGKILSEISANGITFLRKGILL